MQKITADPQALFRYRGLPPVGVTVSMALQHLVAMIVGCVTPAIIIANAAGLTHSARLYMFGYHVAAFDNDFALGGAYFQHLALFVLVLTGQDDDCIAFFDVNLIHFTAHLQLQNLWGEA